MYVKGVSLYYQDNVDQAFKNFEQVLCLNPHHIKTFDTYQVLIFYDVLHPP